MEQSQLEIKYNTVVEMYEGSGYPSLIEFWTAIKKDVQSTTDDEMFEALNEKIIFRHGSKINS